MCDFGLSCVKPPREVLKEQVGSPLWMAPGNFYNFFIYKNVFENYLHMITEVLAGGTYDERCDVSIQER